MAIVIHLAETIIILAGQRLVIYKAIDMHRGGPVIGFYPADRRKAIAGIIGSLDLDVRRIDFIRGTPL